MTLQRNVEAVIFKSHESLQIQSLFKTAAASANHSSDVGIFMGDK